MLKHWILVNDKLKEVDMMTWAEWLENSKSPGRITAKTLVGKIRVSTVFFGLDHSFGGRVPLLWETMIFGSKLKSLAEYQERYSTLKSAKEGHQKAVKFVKGKLLK